MKIYQWSLFEGEKQSGDNMPADIYALLGEIQLMNALICNSCHLLDSLPLRSRDGDGVPAKCDMESVMHVTHCGKKHKTCTAHAPSAHGKRTRGNSS